MLNILLPAMGQNMFFQNFYFPKLMLEVCGETILEKVIKNYSCIQNKHFIFVFGQKDCKKFHIDQSARIITEPDSKMIILKNETAGALCTCLLAVEEIDNETPLFIANFDQIIDADYKQIFLDFEKRSLDVGLITFPSIHPRWSYVRTEGTGVTEVSEKRPISRHAVAGAYYFHRGSYFIEAAKRAILKESSYDGQYYISASINELILMNKKVGFYEIGKEQYHSFYSPEKISEYERGVSL